MMRLLWTETAKRDLQRIYNYIVDDSEYYATKFVDGLITKADNIKSFPMSGRVVPEIGDKNTREFFYYSYRVMYTISSKSIYITQISHMSRDFKA